jgi:hypothetical protein
MTPEHRKEKTAWDNALEQLAIAADVLNLDVGMRRILGHCQLELTVNFPVKETTEQSRSTPAIAFTTTERVGQPKAASAFTRT